MHSILASAAGTAAATSDSAGYSWLGSGTPLEWGIFTVVVGAMLIIDLTIASRHDDEVRAKPALIQTAFWILLALCYGGYLWYAHSQDHSLLFLTGFVIEKALSVDNLFVFLVVFSFFKIRPSHQRRVLFWGILTAVVLRAVLIFLGAAIVARFHWILYIFGAFLLYTAYHLLFSKGDEEVDPEKNRVLLLMRRYVPISPKLDGNHFLTRQEGRLMATPLLAVLVVIETTDVVFALDSVPAIFAITQDPFLIYTSNIFAILGLRALYFALASMLGKFRYLNVGLALVLAFVGVKLLIEEWVHVPIPVSLGVVFTLITGAVIASLLNPSKDAPPHMPHGPHPEAPGTGGTQPDGGTSAGEPGAPTQARETEPDAAPPGKE